MSHFGFFWPSRGRAKSQHAIASEWAENINLESPTGGSQPGRSLPSLKPNLCVRARPTREYQPRIADRRNSAWRLSSFVKTYTVLICASLRVPIAAFRGRTPARPHAGSTSCSLPELLSPLRAPINSAPLAGYPGSGPPSGVNGLTPVPVDSEFLGRRTWTSIGLSPLLETESLVCR